MYDLVQRWWELQMPPPLRVPGLPVELLVLGEPIGPWPLYQQTGVEGRHGAAFVGGSIREIGQGVRSIPAGAMTDALEVTFQFILVGEHARWLSIFVRNVVASLSTAVNLTDHNRMHWPTVQSHTSVRVYGAGRVVRCDWSRDPTSKLYRVDLEYATVVM